MPELNERWLEEAAALRRARTPFVLATVVAREPPQSARVGAHALVHADGRIDGWIGGGCVRPTVVREARAALAEGRPRLVRLNPGADPDPRSEVRVFVLTCQGEGAVDIYLEPVLPAPVLLVLGATPVGRALARLAPEAGLDVAELDPALVPGGDAGVTQLSEQVVAALAGAGERFLVVATMGEGDEEALEVAVREADGAYVGLVASRKKAESLFAYLRARGLPAERMGNVKAPAGLDLGAATPGEIAVSILAEIVQARRVRAAGGDAVREGSAPSARAGARPEPQPADGAARGDTAREAPPTSRRSLQVLASPEARPVRRLAGLETAAAQDAPAPMPESTPASVGLATDPVCGMTVDPATARHTHTLADGRTFYFCCPHCRVAFEKEPEKYLAAQ